MVTSASSLVMVMKRRLACLNCGNGKPLPIQVKFHGVPHLPELSLLANIYAMTRLHVSDVKTRLATVICLSGNMVKVATIPVSH
jgi:hypothetical protein